MTAPGTDDGGRRTLPRPGRRAVLARLGWAAGLLATGPIVAGTTGCVGLTAQLLYAFNGGDLVPAKYDGLVGKRTAVICRSDLSAAGYSPECADLQRKLTIKLANDVKEIKIVGESAVSEWNLDGESDFDPRRIGRAVEADRVVFVELRGLTTQEDPTMYKGRADAEILVYDMEQKGKIVYQDSLMDWKFPDTAGIHSSEMKPTQFQEIFIAKLAIRIAHNFYAYDMKEDFGDDARILHH